MNVVKYFVQKPFSNEPHNVVTNFFVAQNILILPLHEMIISEIVLNKDENITYPLTQTTNIIIYF